jgi:uncharacterized damage-inducible protein DinB
MPRHIQSEIVKSNDGKIAQLFLADVQKRFDQHVSSIGRCLSRLSEEEIWWRPNAASNSAGNLVLHLSGNIRQWIVSGVGGAPDVRMRDSEFAERGPIPKRALIAKLRTTVRKAKSVLKKLPPEVLLQTRSIQGFRVTGVEAVAHVYEHFSHHAGQIIYLTKLKRGQDLQFTRLPPIKKKRGS